MSNLTYLNIDAIKDSSIPFNKLDLDNLSNNEGIKNPYSLNVGEKSYNGSESITIKAKDLGLESALKYHGTTTSNIVDDATTKPIVIDGKNHNQENGCVVFYGKKEFVWNGSKWEEFGNEGNYKVVQTAVSSPSANGNATAFIDTISQDTNGNITVTKKNVDLSNTAPKTHTHDDRYYTESEIDTKVTNLNTAIGGKVSKSGDTMTGNLTFDCSSNAERFVQFNDMAETAFNWRIGYLGSGGGDANYLAFQSSHGATTDSAKWTSALQLGLQTFDATFAGNILPASGLTKNLGSSTRCFSKTYTRYLDTPSSYDLRLCSSGNELLTLGSATGNLHVTNSILPKTNANTSSNLGSSDAKWYNIFASNFVQGKYIRFDVENSFETDISTSFRTKLLGRCEPEAFVRTARTGATAVGPFLGDYASFITWGCGDTQGFIQTSYSDTKKIKVGGGNRDNINWTVDLIHSDNYSTYCAPKTHTHYYAASSSVGGSANTVNVSQSTGTSNFPVTFVSNNTVSSSSMFVGASNNLTINPSTGEAKSKSFTAETKVTVGSSFIQYNSTTGCLEITA